MGFTGFGAGAGRGGAEAAGGGLLEAVDPGVVAAGESVGEGFFEAGLLFAGGFVEEVAVGAEECSKAAKSLVMLCLRGLVSM